MTPEKPTPAPAPMADDKTKPNEGLDVYIDADLLDVADDLSFPASDPPAVTSISRRPTPPKQGR